MSGEDYKWDRMIWRSRKKTFMKTGKKCIVYKTGCYGTLFSESICRKYAITF